MTGTSNFFSLHDVPSWLSVFEWSFQVFIEDKMSSKSKKRVELTLQEKLAVLKAAESGRSQRDLAKDFGVGKTQIGTILKRKREITEAFERNEASTKRRCSYASSNDELNEKVWKWFNLARAQNLPVSGPMIQQQALDFAKKLGKTDFKASNGWLESFKKRHNISSAIACGESASVDPTTVSDWTAKLPELCRGYSRNDIFNMDETGLFFRALPDRTLSIRGEDCHGGKRSKERLTVALCCSWTGEMLKPLVIGKSENPRCFRNLRKESLPVVWRNNKKAWMNGELFTEWIQDLNRAMRLQKRSILLFIDNAPSHPKDLVYSNLKVTFFPANTTSKLQPLDQGIIKNFKHFYKKCLLTHVLSQVNGEKTPSAAAITKGLTVLHACRWISQAAKEVLPETIANCFRHAGFQAEADCPAEPDVADDQGDDLTAELRELVATTAECLDFPEPSDADDYLSLDASAPANEELSDNWVNELLNETPEAPAVTSEAIEVSDDDGSDGEIEPLAIRSLADAREYARQLELYALEHDLPDLHNTACQASSILAHECLTRQMRRKQTTIEDFFTSKS